MAESSIIDILSKAENSETISLFEEILTFVKEIKPVLDKINSSIEENIKKMPVASMNISKVTEATELATNEILDIVDRIFPKIDSVTEKLKEVHNDKLNIQKKILNFLQSIEKGIKGEIDLSSLLPEIRTAIIKQQDLIDNFNEDIIKQPLDDLQTLSSDASSIMISLQVQDITSQQLAAVKHLLDTIQNKLSGILDKFHNSDIRHFLDISSKEENSENITTLHKEIAFDPQAVDAYDLGANRQDMVDEIFNLSETTETINDNNSNEEVHSEILDEDINKNPKQSTNDIEPNISDTIEESINSEIEAAKDDNSEKPKAENNEKINNEDIDAMFLGDESDKDEEISQDDIDKLFAGS